MTLGISDGKLADSDPNRPRNVPMKYRVSYSCEGHGFSCLHRHATVMSPDSKEGWRIALIAGASMVD